MKNQDYRSRTMEFLELPDSVVDVFILYVHISWGDEREIEGRWKVELSII